MRRLNAFGLVIVMGVVGCSAADEAPHKGTQPLGRDSDASSGSGGDDGTTSGGGSGSADPPDDDPSGAAGSEATGGFKNPFAGAGGRKGGSGGSRATGAGGRSNSGGRAGGSTPGGTGGSDGTAGTRSAGKFVGNITTSYSNNVDTNGKKFSTYWDQITPENAGKWGSVQQSVNGSPNWSAVQAIYDYAQTNKIIFKQHAFVWGSQAPNDSGSAGEAEVKKWMTSFCTKFPNTELIDVVNEPFHQLPAYRNNIGGGDDGSWQWIVNSFKWAREACPKAILILNDYNNLEWQADHDKFLGVIKALQKANAPIDAIGCQAHDLDNASVQDATVKKFLQELADTGLPIYITELDISTADDQAQLAKYKTWIPYFLEQDFVHGITIWGWIYGSTWSQAPQSGLIQDGKPRAAMTWLMKELGRPAP